MTPDEMVSLSIFLLVAGQETTVGLVGTGLRNLSRFPDAKASILEDKSLMTTAVDELLRYDGPVHLTGRIAGERVPWGDQVFGEGDATLCLASANRDEQQFPDADQLIPDRRSNYHLAFGSGIHFCLGDWLARTQAQIALSAFLSRYPDYHLEEEAPAWNSNLSVRALTTLKASI